MAESWSARARRLNAERDARRREQEAERRRQQRLDRVLKRQLRAKLLLERKRRELRRKLRRQARKQAYKAKKRAFGQCPTCGRANSPGHICSMRFRERNAENLRKRMEKRGMEENPNLWKGRRAA